MWDEKNCPAFRDDETELFMAFVVQMGRVISVVIQMLRVSRIQRVNRDLWQKPCVEILLC